LLVSVSVFCDLLTMIGKFAAENSQPRAKADGLAHEIVSLADDIDGGAEFLREQGQRISVDDGVFNFLRHLALAEDEWRGDFAEEIFDGFLLTGAGVLERFECFCARLGKFVGVLQFLQLINRGAGGRGWTCDLRFTFRKRFGTGRNGGWTASTGLEGCSVFNSGSLIGGAIGTTACAS